ncbi:hypothetical protein [Puniceibacterium sp. IMCC21224]|uniref:hypothetical protein n=1 Tax=Puniceibacterium sp. IMCC21224 TaxID=1618204 RepID=UPI00065D88C1|nr:hypothetical protein [Puniceibacterium sp. IMCC21224]KMK63795.1 hypothetical protein IMCC21224_1930 [Puniceibacterium sp. IMCC21224]
MHPTPDQILEARATALSPTDGDRIIPAVLQNAWFTLKEAQGHPVTRAATRRIARPLFDQFTGPPDPGPHGLIQGANPIDTARIAAFPATRRAIDALRAMRPAPTGGDAA